MRVGCGALEAPVTQGAAATDHGLHRFSETVQMTSAEQQQQQLTSESDTSGATVHQNSVAQATSDGSLHGIEAVADMHLHEGSDDDAGAPDGCSVSGSGPGGDDDEISDTHTAAGGDELSYGDKVYWDKRYARELAPGSAAPPHFDWCGPLLPSQCTASHSRVYWESRRALTPAGPHIGVGRRYLGYADSPLQEILREHVPLSMPILQVSA
jgi:hypothetical protein